MATSTKKTSKDGGRLIDTIEDVEQSSLEAVRKFVDTVDGALPNVGEDGSRRKVLDSAFKMVEQLVGASNQFARNALKVAEDALADAPPKAKAAASKAKAAPSKARASATKKR